MRKYINNNIDDVKSIKDLRDYKDERNIRIQKKLKAIEDLYNLAFTSGTSKIKMMSYKGKFILSANEKELTLTAKQLASKIKDLKKGSEQSKILAERLTHVHTQIVSLVREEFRTIRNKNERVSTIED